MALVSDSSRANSKGTARRAERRAADGAWWSDGRDKSTEVADRADTARLGAQLRLSEDRDDRVALAAALAAMRTGETPEATAGAIGAILVALAGFGGVALFGFEPNGDVVPLASLDRDGRPVTLAGSLPPGRVAYLRERASRGPWIEDWHPAPDHPYHAFGVEHAITALAYVPIRSEDDVVGLLIVSASAGKEQALVEHQAILAECAAFAGALLGPQVRSRAAAALSEARIRAVIAERAFLPVFQPIVELAERAVVGYEALTRFTDGRPPNDVFAEATRCGLALDLEAATLAAAVESAGPRQASAWLNLNVSPEFVLAGEPLASIVGACRWPIVLELTEHLPVSDYGALRAALDRLGSDVRLAVDDAGAGFASLRHILELRPTYVKLDRTIVHGLHRDAARRALDRGDGPLRGRDGRRRHRRGRRGRGGSARPPAPRCVARPGLPLRTPGARRSGRQACARRRAAADPPTAGASRGERRRCQPGGQRRRCPRRRAPRGGDRDDRGSAGASGPSRSGNGYGRPDQTWPQGRPSSGSRAPPGASVSPSSRRPSEPDSASLSGSGGRPPDRSIETTTYG